MSRSYAELSTEIARLTRQADVARASERTAVIAAIKAQMAEYGITTADLRRDQHGRAAKRTGSVPRKKYRHPETGQTWSGRGKRPAWIVAAVEAGSRIEEFLVDWPGAW